jgi:uncharacterized small protein (DUF1192 family)
MVTPGTDKSVNFSSFFLDLTCTQPASPVSSTSGAEAIETDELEMIEVEELSVLIGLLSAELAGLGFKRMKVIPEARMTSKTSVRTSGVRRLPRPCDVLACFVVLF